MTLSDLSKVKTVHFIGIGGIGISAIARMFLLEGKSVSGSDAAESEVTEALREAGAIITIKAEEKMGIFQRSAVGRCPSSIPADCDLVIYTIAIPNEHSELVEAKRRGILALSYPEALGIVSKDKYTIAVAGTHGKTTTTAMIAKILIDAGFDPTVIVGSLIKDAVGNRTNFIAGKSKYLVVEACEYKRSFLNINPKIVVITNIDADHLDYYKDITGVIKGFSEFAMKAPKSGFVVTDTEDKNIKLAIKNLSCKVVDYKKLKIKDCKLKIPGRHNISNAQAAMAVAEILRIDKELAFKSLEDLSGTWRRFEERGRAENGALVYDDYGHHPTEITATLAGARELFPKQKIVVVFQPHLYSRTKDHLKAFGQCFKDADEVILLPIYPAREKDPGDISSEMVVAEIKKNGQSAHFVPTFAEAAKKSAALAGGSGVIVTMGAGETNKVADLLIR